MVPKVLELRGGGSVSGDLVVMATQALFGGYTVACLFRPDLMTTLHFDQKSSPITDFWCRGTALPMASIIYLLTKLSPEDSLKFVTVFNALATLIWPWNGEFFSKLGGTPLHKVPTILFPLLSVAGLLAR